MRQEAEVQPTETDNMTPKSLPGLIFSAWARAREMSQDGDDSDTKPVPVADGDETMEHEE